MEVPDKRMPIKDENIPNLKKLLLSNIKEGLVKEEDVNNGSQSSVAAAGEEKSSIE